MHGFSFIEISMKSEVKDVGENRKEHNAHVPCSKIAFNNLIIVLEESCIGINPTFK